MRRGDVVILDYPFSDASGSKVRPALVVQNDADNSRRSNTILVMTTKSIRGIRTQVVIDVTTPDGQASGLHITSAVNCSDIYTVNSRHIIHTIGHLSDSFMRQVDDGLKAALDLQ